MDKEKSAHNLLQLGNETVTHVNIYPCQLEEYSDLSCLAVQTRDGSCYMQVFKDSDSPDEDRAYRIMLYDEYPILDGTDLKLEPVVTRYCAASEIYSVNCAKDGTWSIKWTEMPRLRSDRVAWAMLCMRDNRCKTARQLDENIRHMRRHYERKHNEQPNLHVTAYQTRKINLSDWFTIVYSTDESGEVNNRTFYRWFMREAPSADECRQFLVRMKERTSNEEIKMRIDYVLETIK